jgi:hypothetical protein
MKKAIVTKAQEKKAKKMEEAIAAYIKSLPDLTLETAWTTVNQAAYSIEQAVFKSGISFTTPRVGFLLSLASDMRKRAEQELGPQPGYGPRKVVPK